MRLRVITLDTSDSARLLNTHETQGDYMGLMRLFIIIKTEGDS